MNEINFDEERPAAAEQLTALSLLVGKMQVAQTAVADYTEMLKEAQRNLRGIEEIDIPEMMAEVGLESVTLADGTMLEVKETLYASIAAKNKRAAIAWLIDNGQAALVKEDVIVPFDKGDVEKAQLLVGSLQEMGYATVKINEAVNTGSVKSVIVEMLAQGVDIPLDLFGAHFVKKAVLK